MELQVDISIFLRNLRYFFVILAKLLALSRAVPAGGLMTGGLLMEAEMAASGAQTHSAGNGAPGPAPRQDAFTILGPGGGGTMQIPTISPHDPNLVVEACDMTGAYITTNGAQSWRMFNLHTGIRSYAFDPGDPAVIYAGNGLLWRSTDRGGTWRVLFPDPAQNLQEYHRGDHGDTSFSSDDPNYPKDGRGAA